jgi:hypothetical protein
MKTFVQSLLLLALIAATAYAKRLPPPEVTPVKKDGIEYRELGNKVQAIDIQSGEEIWRKEIFVIVYLPKLEKDVQDVCITNLSIEEDKLLVDVEGDNRYELDLESLDVKVIEGYKVISNKNDHYLKTRVKEAECSGDFRSEECLDKRQNHASEVVTQGYDFKKYYADDERKKIGLKEFAQIGYLKGETNENSCAKIVWNDGTKDHTLYDSKQWIARAYDGNIPKLCEVGYDYQISLAKKNSKTMILMEFYEGDPHGGRATDMVGKVCEIDFKAKKLIHCNSKRVAIN